MVKFTDLCNKMDEMKIHTIIHTMYAVCVLNFNESKIIQIELCGNESDAEESARSHAAYVCAGKGIGVLPVSEFLVDGKFVGSLELKC